ncbi:hypothetical protein SAMN05216598_0177 [Pseudomonas asplenii]|uniref:Uncharacterized protein n=1 Tax=Pseudomonas asplenii TaxID=53407 RepID=A0A1H1NK77_9PSED|nr:hypothetical protein [Pseudomonas asplenii]SDR99392.1 hypothetical protein SAMN05216598_0177 [Pseudomonas asplenii]
MRTTKKHFEAERQRAQYLTARNTGASTREEVEIAPVTLTNLLPDVPGGQPGLISRAELNSNGLMYDIPQWVGNNVPGPDYLTIKLGNVTLDPIIRVDKPLAGKFPMKLSIPKSLLGADGLKKLHYEVQTSGIQYGIAEPVSFTVDLYDPNTLSEPKAVELPAEVGDLLTGDYLDDHGGVEVTIPPYSDPHPGDWYEFFWSYFDTQPIARGDLPGDGTAFSFTIPATAIVAQQDGEKYLTYKLWDRAGNDSKPAKPYPLRVVIDPVPSNLQPPRVPLAPIDLKDAQIGVTVEIDRYDNAMIGDSIVVSFNGHSLVKPLDRLSFPASVNVPWETLKAGGVTAPYTAPVSYKIVRGGDNYDYTPPISVDVDLSVAGGGVNPIDPGPINPDLDPPLVTSSEDEENELGPGDIGEPATVTFDLYDDVAIGHQVQLYWGTEAVFSPAHTVDDADLTRGHFELIVPWTVIDTVKNGAHPVYYTLNNNINDNEIESPRTTVNVNIFEIGDLEVVTFMRKIDLTPGLFLINCTHQPYNGIPLRILDRTHIKVGDQIVVEWRLLQGFETETEIGAAAGDFPIEVTQDHSDAGHPGELLTVPYSPYIELGGFESKIRVRYRLIKADGFGGGTSDPAEALLLQQELDGEGCRITLDE